MEMLHGDSAPAERRFSAARRHGALALLVMLALAGHISADKLPSAEDGALAEQPAAPVFRHGTGFVILSGEEVSDKELCRVAALRGLQQLRIQGDRPNDQRISMDGLCCLAKARDLKMLDLSNLGLADDDLQALAPLTQIEDLTLHIRIRDAGLEHLKGLIHLKKLSVASVRVHGSGLRWLQNAKGLARLDLHLDSADGDGIAALDHLDGLEHLTLNCMNTSDKALSRLNGLRNLKELRIAQRTPVGERALEAVGSLSQLRSLQLAGLQMAPTGLKHLSNLHELRRLNLDRAVGAEQLAFLEGLLHLESLDLSFLPIDDHEALHLANLKELQELKLMHCGISADGFGFLAQFSRLHKLDATMTKIDINGLRSLKSLKEMDSLMLGGCRIDDDALENLEDLDRLTELNLSGSQVGDEGIKHLANLQQLRYLFLSNTNVSDESIAVLSGLSKLSLLEVVETRVTDAGIQQLKAKLPKLHVRSRAPRPKS